MIKDQVKFNIFSFISTFARSLIEIFISLYLFKNGFSITSIIAFYCLENIFSLFLSYLFIRIGERFNYAIIMIIGLIAFVALQIVLGNVENTWQYVLIISLIYSLYRRGYWVSRRNYITSVMPTKESSNAFSILVVLAQISTILAGYVGAILLDNFSMTFVTIASSALLVLSVIPLFLIKTKKEPAKINLIANMKKYEKSNYLLFAFYELNNLLTMLFPIYIALYIQDTYIMAGNLNAISNISIIVFVMIYGRIINKNKNFVFLSTVLLLIISLLKVLQVDYFVLAIYFLDGLVQKMQNQSINKIYFENRKDMDITHYNLIYQITEAISRFIVAIPLLFMTSIRQMIVFIVVVIFVELLIYEFMRNKKKEKE
ncbi:MAG: MFS transporter [Clostridia bacterium]|nr:MFS transporter [Clostridia bacterium]